MSHPAKKRKLAVDWLSENALKDWLKFSDDRTVASCIYCKKPITATNKNDLVKHASRPKHLLAKAEYQKDAIEAKGLGKFVVTKELALDSHNAKVARAEVELASHFSRANTPFNQASELILSLKKAFPDSNILKDVRLNKTKMEYCVVHGLGESGRLEIAKDLQKFKFSVGVDETTDCSTKAIMMIVVRYMKEGQLMERIIGAPEVNDSSALGLYSTFKTFFENMQVPLENILAVVTDNCSTMTGSVGGFTTLLQKDVPNVVVIPCLCHLLALACSHAAEELPS